ncbi:hypothetical protein ACW7G0_00770 [Lysobacter sp. A286]
MNRVCFVILMLAALALSACDRQQPEPDVQAVPDEAQQQSVVASRDVDGTAWAAIDSAVLAAAAALPSRCYLDKVNGETNKTGYAVKASKGRRV